MTTGSPDSETETISTEVPALLAGVRLDRGVAMVAGVSRAAAADLVQSGRVLVDGEAVRVGRSSLEEGSMLTILVPAALTTEVSAEPDVSFRVVYADEAVAVVDKPAGLVVHPGAGHGSGTLVGGLLARFPDLSDLVASGVCAPDRPGIVHRLDKGTSGLLAVARTAEAYRGLVFQLAERTMERRYLALVTGEVEEDQGEVDAPIGRSARTPTKMAVSASGKPARTAYTVVQRWEAPGPNPVGAVLAQRQDPSDPGAHGGDRSPRRRRPPLRHVRPSARPGPLLPPRLPAGVRPPCLRRAPRSDGTAAARSQRLPRPASRFGPVALRRMDQ